VRLLAALALELSVVGQFGFWRAANLGRSRLSGGQSRLKAGSGDWPFQLGSTRGARPRRAVSALLPTQASYARLSRLKAGCGQNCPPSILWTTWRWAGTVCSFGLTPILNRPVFVSSFPRGTGLSAAPARRLGAGNGAIARALPSRGGLLLLKNERCYEAMVCGPALWRPTRPPQAASLPHYACFAARSPMTGNTTFFP